MYIRAYHESAIHYNRKWVSEFLKSAAKFYQLHSGSYLVKEQLITIHHSPARTLISRACSQCSPLQCSQTSKLRKSEITSHCSSCMHSLTEKRCRASQLTIVMQNCSASSLKCGFAISWNNCIAPQSFATQSKVFFWDRAKFFYWDRAKWPSSSNVECAISRKRGSRQTLLLYMIQIDHHEI